MSKRAHIRRRKDSDDEDNDQQPADEDINEQNSNDGSDNGYEHVFFSIVLFSHSLISIEQQLKILN